MKSLDEQLAQAKAARAAAEAAFTEADAAEESKRALLADERKAESEAATRKRDLDLARRLESAIGEGDPREFRAVIIEGFADTFIIRRNGTAHAKWERALESAASNDRNKKKADKEAASRAYAIASVVDWNGDTDFQVGLKRNLGDDLDKFLTVNPGIVTPLNNAAGRVNGVFAEERKS